MATGVVFGHFVPDKSQGLSFSVIKELIDLDERFERGVAEVAAALGRLTYSSEAYRYWIKMPFMRGSWKAFSDIVDTQQRKKFLVAKKNFHERPDFYETEII